MTRRGFADPREAAAFDAAYAAVVDRWPVPAQELDLISEHGTTHVIASGPSGASPVVLLPGGGATATAWFALAGPLPAPPPASTPSTSSARPAAAATPAGP